MHEEADRLIPGLDEWNNGQGIGVSGFLAFIANPSHVIAYATLFWPDFIIHDDCIFLHKPNEHIYQQWLTTCKGDRTEVESVMNHLHLLDVFVNADSQPPKEALVHIGRVLSDMWQCRLRRDFPDRPIVVEFFDGSTTDLLDIVITVFQKRPKMNHNAEPRESFTR